VINATELSNSAYSPHVPASFIKEEYSSQLLSKVINRQKQIMTNMKEKKDLDDIDPRAFLIMDDCMYDERWVRDVNIRNIFMNGRHYKLFFILALQYCLGIPPVLRTNIDYVFLMRENIYQNKIKLYQLFGGMFRSLDTFCQVFDECTENYGCMVIYLGAKSSKIEDMVFWYKSQDHGNKWRACLPYFWEMQKRGEAMKVFDGDEETDRKADTAPGRVRVRKIGEQ
jgi:hypothetical protein